LHHVEIPYEEREVVFRQVLLLERALRDGNKSLSMESHTILTPGRDPRWTGKTKDRPAKVS